MSRVQTSPGQMTFADAVAIVSLLAMGDRGKMTPQAVREYADALTLLLSEIAWEVNVGIDDALLQRVRHEVSAQRVADVDVRHDAAISLAEPERAAWRKLVDATNGLRNETNAEAADRLHVKLNDARSTLLALGVVV